MENFDADLFRRFWNDLSGRPGYSETDLLLRDSGRKYAKIFRARNHSLACEAAGGDCARCPLPGQGGGLRCMSSGGSSLYVRWRTAMRIAKLVGRPNFEELRKEVIEEEAGRFGFEGEVASQDDPRLFANVPAREAQVIAKGLAREIARLPWSDPGRGRKMKWYDFLQMILSFPQGREFTAADFRLFGTSSLVGWHLCALAHAGRIRRVGHGRYVYDGTLSEFVPLRRKIICRMRGIARERGDADAEFTRDDFDKLANVDAISQQLSRLARAGEIARNSRGRYMLSRKNRPVILAKRKGARPGGGQATQ